MSFIEILVLVGIVAAFTAFGLVLAWGNHQTRHLPPMRTEAEAQAQARAQARDARDAVKEAA